MNKKVGNPSGFTDTLPAQQLRFNRLMEELSVVVESFGFSPIDTPEVEWMDTLTGHDDQGGKLIYRVFNGYENPEEEANWNDVMDKGLRFDLTVPLARFYGQHINDLPHPFKRYHWGKVFRGETAQTGKGRYREFYQFDADIIGATGSVADAEIAAMLADAMKRLALPAVIKINNRRLLDGLVELGGISDPDQKAAVFTAIDKFDKIGLEKVIAEVLQQTNPEFAELVTQYLQVGGSNEEKLAALSKILAGSQAAQEGLQNLKEMFSLLTASGYGEMIKVSPEIVRGLGYYTGAIFETLITGFEQFGSVASGGRYDNLIEDLGGPSEPAVGASFGVSRLLDVLSQFNWEGGAQTPAQVLIVNFAPELSEAYFGLASRLRASGVPTLLYPTAKKMGQQLKYASDQGVPYALIYGEDESAKGTVLVRDMNTREQTELQLSEVADWLAKHLSDKS